METVTAGSARRALIVAAGALLLAGCAAAPYLIPAGIEFARNLLMTATNNYGTRYSEDMARLIARLTQPYVSVAAPAGTPQYPVAAATYPGQGGAASPGTGPSYPAQSYPGYPGGAPSGSPGPYGTPSPSYPPQPGYPGAPAPPYGSPPAYPAQPAVNPYGQYPATGQPGQAAYPAAPPPPSQYPSPQYGASPPSGYPPQAAPPSSYPPGVPTGAYPQYGSPPAPPYPVQPPGQPAGAYGQAPATGYGAPGTYGGQPGSPPVAGYPGQPQYGTQYPPAGIFSRSIPNEPVAVDVALVRQQITAQGRLVVLMNDGEVLRDNPANPQAGDKFKLVFRTNCDCYAYVVAIDGSGWAQGIFPSGSAQATNPVRKDQEYVFPVGANWFALDQVKGVETFYIVVSPVQRVDLEESIARVAGNERPVGRGTGRVESPAVIPDGFGSKEAGRATTVRSESGQQAQITPLTYVAKGPGEAVTVTRWFKHE